MGHGASEVIWIKVMLGGLRICVRLCATVLAKRKSNIYRGVQIFFTPFSSSFWMGIDSTLAMDTTCSNPTTYGDWSISWTSSILGSIACPLSLSYTRREGKAVAVTNLLTWSRPWHQRHLLSTTTSQICLAWGCAWFASMDSSVSSVVMRPLWSSWV